MISNKLPQNPAKYSLLYIAVLSFLLLQFLYSNLGQPKPFITDEFSYILAAETFAQGHLTNPSPSLPQFFENAHIITTPSYTTKYPPGQSAIIALGELIFHQPYYGIMLAMLFFSISFFWLLKSFAGNIYSIALSLLITLILSLTSSWARSYIPGALPAAGMCLLLGSYLHSFQQKRFTKKCTFTAACLILSLTRPYEGLIFVTAIIILLIYDIYKKNITTTYKQLILTIILATIVVITTNSYYNYTVTGNLLLSPNMLHIKQYMHAPYFWFAPIQTPILHPNVTLIDHLYKTWETQQYFLISSLPNQQKITYFLQRLYISNYRIFPITLIILTLSLFIKNLRAINVRLLILLLLGLTTSSLIVWMPDYYLFGAVVICLTSLAYTVFQLSIICDKQFPLPRYKLALAPVVALLFTTWLIPVIDEAAYAKNFFSNWKSPFERKQELVNDLEQKSQSNLVFVRYKNYTNAEIYNDATLYNMALTYVYNSPNIDNQKTIFAHDLGKLENQKLISYYNSLNQNRHLWLLDLSNVNSVYYFNSSKLKITEISYDTK